MAAERFWTFDNHSRNIETKKIINPSCPNPGRREKIKLNFYFKNINVGIQFNGKQYCHKQVHFCGK